MPSDLVFKTANTVHQALLKLSGGRIGWSAGKMPVLELTTTGRRSGQQRTTMLTTPLHDENRTVIIASAGGNDTHPAWYRNLEANPAVTVKTKDGVAPMTARILTGAERSEIWEQVTSKYENYADYQKKADREIPVVVLEPA